MKKLLGLLAATGLVASTGATVVACNDPESDSKAVDVTIAADKSEMTAKLTVTYVKDAKFEIASDKTAAASILEVTATDVTAEAQESTITFKVKDTATREADVTEKITVKYNSAEVQVYNVKIVKAAATETVELKIADIKANAAITAITAKASLEEVNTALEAVEITGVKSLVAVVNETTATSVDITVTPDTGYTIDNATFTLENAINAA